jgi:hypothetical protein
VSKSERFGRLGWRLMGVSCDWLNRRDERVVLLKARVPQKNHEGREAITSRPYGLRRDGKIETVQAEWRMAQHNPCVSGRIRSI